VRLILIDPKVVELAEYNGIPHLRIPVVTEPRLAAKALGQAVVEMEQRYHTFAEHNVRDINSYNKLAARYGGLEKMPHVAIVIDELADLMMTAGKDVENYICRIAQKARAAGMHLIVATQRPSVDVITGLIKSNIPSRIAFAVSSQVDSRTILDGAGAEKLLGMGDMLFMPIGANKPVRVQGTYVKDSEISKVLQYLKDSSETEYDEAFLAEMDKVQLSGQNADKDVDDDDEGGDLLRDATFVSAVEMALDAGEISTSGLQRRLRLGYARAGRIVDQMERLHIVSEPNGSKPRQVLISRSQWQEMAMNSAE
jgi:S-DNA-T family DNA segregation ATPase FtsK/SpoIIIE